MLQKPETEIIKMCQTRHRSKEIEATNAGNRVPSASSIYQLGPFIDQNCVFRVGERLVKSNLSHELKHSVLFPKYYTISQFIISYYHEKRDGHQ